MRTWVATNLCQELYQICQTSYFVLPKQKLNDFKKEYVLEMKEGNTQYACYKKNWQQGWCNADQDAEVDSHFETDGWYACCPSCKWYGKDEVNRKLDFFISNLLYINFGVQLI